MFSILLILASAAHPSWQSALPQGAVVIETARVPSLLHQNRLLVLWMRDSHEDGREIERDEPYTCPDRTRGSRYISGEAAVSLVDISRQRIINTVHLDPPDDPYLDVPLRIRRGLYWTPATGIEGKPVILRLRDLNGDGLDFEFPLYQEDSCSLIWGTLVGYSESHDQAVWYEVHLKVIEGAHVHYTLLHWIESLYQGGAKGSGRWSYTRAYPEEHPSQYVFDIRSDTELERFEGTETIISLEP